MLMQRVSGGYTIIEVMIFLAISGVLLIMSLTFLSGRQTHTEFSQSMRDIQSKTQDWINDATTGFPGGVSGTNAGDIQCKVSGASVKINVLASPSSNDGGCIFLGKAIQFIDNPSTSVYAYSVFGQRVDASTGDLVADLKTSGPTPAVGGSTGNAHLTEIYTLKSGAHMKSIKGTIAGATTTSHLAGFYLSLNTEKSIGQNGSTSLKAYQYKLTGNYAGDSPEAVECIKNISPCNLAAGETSPPPLSNWEICFLNDSNSDTAVLTVASPSGLGVSTKLEFKPC